MDRHIYTKDDIAKKVSQILRENYFDNPPIDVYALIGNYGITIHERKFPLEYANVSGFVSFPDDAKDTAIFVLNRADSDDRKKFTLAHEFGHWVLHKNELLADPTLSILYKSPLGSETTDQMEIEANLFAAQLLVPDAMFSEHSSTSIHKKELAEKFKVGEDIIGFRLDQRDDAVAHKPAK